MQKDNPELFFKDKDVFYHLKRQLVKAEKNSTVLVVLRVSTCC